MEAQFESAQFDAELFSMANNTDFAIPNANKENMETWTTVDFVVGDDEYAISRDQTTNYLSVTLETPEALSTTTSGERNGAKFFINGFEEASTIDANKFTVADSTLDSDSNVYKTVVTLGAEIEDGKELTITYCIPKANKQYEILVDNQSTFVGEMILRWPRHTWAA